MKGILFLQIFSLTYDITKIDDGTVNGDNDMQIIAINELLKSLCIPREKLV